MDEKELMARVRKGDKVAFGELIKMYQQPMFYYINGFLNDRDRSLDLVQDLFLKVWRYRKKYEESGKFKAWIYRIANNLVKNYVKKEKRNVELMENISYDDITQEDIEKNELIEKVKEAIDVIPDIYREPIILRDVEGESYADIAKKLDISIGTVKSRISRGREMVRNYLKEKWGDEIYGM